MILHQLTILGDATNRTRVSIERTKSIIRVTIDKLSPPPSRRASPSRPGVVEPRIDDWRAMADCVMIDPSFDGKVFEIGLSDVPERKTDVVRGEYEVAAPKGATTVAVKIVDMLGEEVLITKSA